MAGLWGARRGASAGGTKGPLYVYAASRREFLTRTGRGALGLACLAATPWVSGCASLPRVSPIREGAVARIPLSAFETTSGVLFDHREEGMPVYVHQHSTERFTAGTGRRPATACLTRVCPVDLAFYDGVETD